MLLRLWPSILNDALEGLDNLFFETVFLDVFYTSTSNCFKIRYLLLALLRGALVSASARYICQPGLKWISRRNSCSQSGIHWSLLWHGHERFLVDHLQGFVVALNDYFPTIRALVKFFCSKYDRQVPFFDLGIIMLSVSQQMGRVCQWLILL